MPWLLARRRRYRAGGQSASSTLLRRRRASTPPHPRPDLLPRLLLPRTWPRGSARRILPAHRDASHLGPVRCAHGALRLPAVRRELAPGRPWLAATRCPARRVRADVRVHLGGSVEQRTVGVDAGAAALELLLIRLLRRGITLPSGRSPGRCCSRCRSSRGPGRAVSGAAVADPRCRPGATHRSR